MRYCQTFSASHTYNTSGTYQLTIKGDISKINIETTNAYVQSFDQLDLESLKDASASSKSFAGDCSEATGTIPPLPSSLTNGSYMFNRCSGLSGNIPPLPETLTDGSSMFYGCSSLTGKIPELPSSLTDVEQMFFGCGRLEGAAPSLPSLINKDTCGKTYGECYHTFYNTSITNNGSWPDGAW